ncbi:hypothetical protein [Borrelia persica]|uniref:hypothetical protein n=1 Tax=Borrelia persica TaxID=44448 RepID=UPI00046791CA|nr:hypothetical protein [Borrelia persica]
MKRVCVLIFIISFVGILGCVGPAGAPGLRGLAGIDGENGQDQRGDIELLRANFLILKKSYDYNVNALQNIRDGVGKDILFENDVFEKIFSLQKDQDYVYIATRNDDVVVRQISIVLRTLVGDLSVVNVQDRIYARGFLSALKWSAEYVDEVIKLDIFTPDFDLDRLSKFKRSDIWELNFLIVRMLEVREDVANDFKWLLQDLPAVSSMRNRLMPIVDDKNGKIYKKIHVGSYSLKGLKESIVKKIKDIT